MATFLRVQSMPKSTKILLTLLTSISFIIMIIRINKYRSGHDAESTGDDFKTILVPYLQLVPRYTIFNPWVVTTAIFAETGLISFVISLLVLIVATKDVERFWGWREVVKFVLVIGSITNFCTVLVTILVNMLKGDVAGMERPLGGGISYYFSFLVVLKQLIPEHKIVLFSGLVNFRAKHTPFIGLVGVSLYSLIISRSLYPAVPSINSFFISYIYLRFYQSFLSDPLLPITTATGDNSNTSLITGDASDTFKLVEFFPDVSKPYLAPVFAKIYEFGVFLGIVPSFNDDSIEQSNLRAQRRQEQSNHSTKNIANSVAERRRQVALQVIEDRISKDTYR